MKLSKRIISSFLSFTIVVTMMCGLCIIKVEAYDNGIITQVQIEKAINWAESHIDKAIVVSSKYASNSNWCCTYYTYHECTMFIRDAFCLEDGAGLDYISNPNASDWADLWCNNYDKDVIPPRGALCFYEYYGYGHVAISLGDGNAISNLGEGSLIPYYSRKGDYGNNSKTDPVFNPNFNGNWAESEDTQKKIKGHIIEHPYNSSGTNYTYLGWGTWRNYTIDSDFKINANGVLTGYTGTDTEITIPSGVTEIGENAFFGNETIKKVTISGSVKKIGRGAFKNCQNLEYVDYQYGYGQEIGDYAFQGCYKLSEVRMSDSVDSIGPGAFWGCGFTSFTIPNSVTYIGGAAFSDCPNLTEINIPWNVREIGTHAFAAPNIKKITVDDNNQHFTDDNGVLYTKDETRLFAYPAANDRVSYDILTGTKYITSGAFKYCKKLKHLFIPDTVQTFDIEAFNECYSLTNITIPYSVTEIQSYSDTGDYGPFGNCTSLKNIYVDSRNPNYKEINGVLYSKDGTVLVAYPIGRTNQLFTIPSGVRKIGTGSSPFTGCRYLKFLVLPDSVDSFAVSAFMLSSGLKAISIPKGITKLPSSIFSGCSGLISVDIPYGVTSIGDYAFCDCTGLKSITIPSSVTSIGENAFLNCPNLKNIYFAGSKAKWDTIAGISLAEIPSGCNIVGTSNFVWKFVVACPVDVEVYNSSNELVGRVVNNQVDENVTSVTIFVDEETSTKYITTPGNGIYSVKAIGYDSGTMDYSMSMFPMTDSVEAQNYSVNSIIITPNTVVESNTDSSTGVDVVATTPSGDHADYVVDYSIDGNNNVSILENDVIHQYSDEWKFDEKSHWHECSCGKRNDEQGHDSLVDCSICGYRCDHSNCIDVITYPTKTSQGFTTHTCNKCGTVFTDTYTDYVPLVVNKLLDEYSDNVLTWDSYEDALSYSIGEVENNKIIEIATTASTTFTLSDIAEGAHNFVVAAYFEDGHSVVSDELAVNIAKQTVSDFSITVPAKTTYFVTEPIDIKGGSITASFNYGKPKTLAITGDMISGYDSSKAGEVNVTVTYGGVSKSFGIMIKNKSIVDMFISSLPTTEAILGQDLDLTDGQIEVWYDYGEPDTIDITSEMISGYDKTTEGQQTVTVTYKGYTDVFVVNVEKEVTPATYTLTVTAPTFNDVTVGYVQPDAKAITITSTGNSDATISSVTLSGLNADSFTLTNGTVSVIAGGTNTTYTVQPNVGLAIGTYTASIIVTYDNYATATADVTFTVNALNVVATPTFSPAGGEFTSAQSVTISCSTGGATIYYTTDGTVPTTSSTEYTGAIAVSETTIIKAIAVKAGMTNSAIASATYTITDATVAVTSISLDKTTTDVEVGKTITLTATVLPADATDKTVIWSSDMPAVATVANGVVTGVKAGTAKITATAGGKSATCTITVKDSVIAVTGISLNKSSTTLTVGGSETLVATVTPDNATNKTVTWTTSDRSVVVVANGTISATGVGTATITAKAGDKTATCTVTVRSSGGGGNGGGGYTPVIPSGGNDNNNNTNTDKNNDEPKIEGGNGASGWSNIAFEISKTPEGGSVTVDMNGMTTVPKSVLDAVKGKDIDLVLDMGGGITWTINGKDVDSVSGSIDLGVTVGKSEIPANVINNITGEKYSIVISLAHNGDFGFTATLTIGMRKQDAGLYANLFYYNTKTKELEFVCSGKIRKDGSVDLEFTHASDYTIVVDDHPLGQELTATVSRTGKAALSWIAQDGAESYTVYQSKDGKWVKLGTTSKTAYTIKGLTNNMTYKFMVRAKVDGKLVVKADAMTLKLKVYYKPAPKAMTADGRITLTWKEVPDATKYRIYIVKNGKLVKLKDTTKLKYSGKATVGKTYKFAIKAYVNGKWTSVKTSDIIKIKAK